MGIASYINITSAQLAPWSPGALFINTSDGSLLTGGWYHISPTTCFTDTSRTTPAGNGDTVAGVTDLSGNGFHWSQSTAGNRPTLRKLSDAIWYLEFDGSSDFFTSGNTYVLKMPHYVIAAMSRPTGVTGSLFGATKSSTEYHRFGTALSAPERAFAQMRGSGLSTDTASVASADFDTWPLDTIAIFDSQALTSGSAGTLDIGVNGVLKGTPDTTTWATASEITACRIGINTSNGTSGAGSNATKFFGGLVVRRALSTAERAFINAEFQRRYRAFRIDRQVLNRVYQRDVSGGSASVTISGYSPLASPVKYRLLSAADGTTELVASTTLATPGAGGAYSATIAAPAIGKFITEVSDSVVTSLSAKSSPAWGVGHRTLVIGQSLANFMGSVVVSGSGTLQASEAFGSVYFANATAGDPVAIDNFRWLRTYTGHGHRQLARSFIARTGEAIGIINLSEGGSTSNRWTDPLTTDLAIRCRKHMRIACNGSEASTPSLIGSIFWNQGQTPNGAQTKSQMKSDLDEILSWLRAEVGYSVPFIIAPLSKIGSAAPSDSAIYQGIREAHLEWAATNSSNNVHMIGVSDLEPYDEYHLSSDGNNAQAVRLEQAIAYAIGETSSPAVGPSITGLQYTVGTNKVVAVCTHTSGGTGLREADGDTDGIGLTGFEISTNGFSSLVTISATSFVDANKIEFTTGTTFDGSNPPQLRYQYGKNHDVTAPVYDNFSFTDDARGRPLMPTIGYLTATAV